jgi:AbrB family looped-hinge helix DNA binding protein
MATTTISPKFQIVIPKQVREKLRLKPRQRLHVIEKGGSSVLDIEIKGTLKGTSMAHLREKNDR